MSTRRKPGDLCPIRGVSCFNVDCKETNTCQHAYEPPAVPAPPDTSAARKASPVYSGVLAYFPDALMTIARVSKAGNDKHNPGQPLHWSRGKSNDHLDCVARHLLTPFVVDPDSGEEHLAHAAWRILAALQIREEERNADH